MRILVTGPRNWTDWLSVLKALVGMTRGYDPVQVTIVEGEAKGFDTICRQVAEVFGWKVEPHKAEWTVNGTWNVQAGPERNQRMVDSGADRCLAGFIRCTKDNCLKKPYGHGTHGTSDCVHRAMRAGIPVQTVMADSLPVVAEP